MTSRYIPRDVKPLRPGSVKRGDRPLTSLVDRILERGVNLCCLREENLFTAEHELGHKWVRRCRVCGSRHVRMKAESIDLRAVFSGANTIHRRNGVRHIRMGADSASFGAAPRSAPMLKDVPRGAIRYLDL